MLYRKYHPKSWPEVVGQQAAIDQIHRIGRNGYGGRAWWVSGSSGTGKDCIAALIAAEIADPNVGVEELDANDITGDDVRAIERGYQTRCLGRKPGRAMIVSEAQGMKPTAVKQLLVTLQRIPPHVTWVFTTIQDDKTSLFGMDTKGHPLLSRCHDIELASGRDVELEFALRAREVAQAENLDGRDLSEYVSLVRQCNYNLRQAFGRIEQGVMLDG